MNTSYYARVEELSAASQAVIAANHGPEHMDAEFRLSLALFGVAVFCPDDLTPAIRDVDASDLTVMEKARRFEAITAQLLEMCDALDAA